MVFIGNCYSGAPCTLAGTRVASLHLPKDLHCTLAEDIAAQTTIADTTLPMYICRHVFIPRWPMTSEPMPLLPTPHRRCWRSVDVGNRCTGYVAELIYFLLNFSVHCTNTYTILTPGSSSVLPLTIHATCVTENMHTEIITQTDQATQHCVDHVRTPSNSNQHACGQVSRNTSVQPRLDSSTEDQSNTLHPTQNVDADLVRGQT